MAVAVDASSPVLWTNTLAGGVGMASASFTAPANALLVCGIAADGANDGDWAPTEAGVADSGGLAWTLRVKRSWSETTAGAASELWTARTTSAVSRTVTVTRPSGGPGTLRTYAKVYVLTGADVDGTPFDTVGANNEGGSTTNDLTTTSITPGASGVLIVADCDWNASGDETSSDLTIVSGTTAGKITAAFGYKACTSGVGVTGNLNAGGTSACQHKWCQMVFREAGGAAATILRQMLLHA